jgi:hypothetical protein
MVIGRWCSFQAKSARVLECRAALSGRTMPFNRFVIEFILPGEPATKVGAMARR